MVFDNNNNLCYTIGAPPQTGQSTILRR